MEKTIKKIESENLQEQLLSGLQFDFRLILKDKKFVRNGILLVIASALIGGGVGALIDLIYLYSGITNEYAILGIGAGVGAISGLLLGIILSIALKSRMVEDFNVSYGAGIGTNVFIGAIIGIMFGVLIGSLFGIILEAAKLTIGTEFSYIVYGMLVWIVLGLNIGVLIGLIASFGTIQITTGGGISGFIVGGIGILAIFGPNILVLAGCLVGLIFGLFTAIFLKYSLEASIGNVEYPSCTKSCESCDIFEQKILREPEDPQRKRRTTTSSCNGSSDCGSCDGGSCDGNCGEAAVPIILVVLIAIPIVILVWVLSWGGTKASVKLGDTVKRGAFTAVGACFSIFVIIGSNVGLTESFHNMLFEYNVLIGAGLGLVFSALIIGVIALSQRKAFITITPTGFIWKDGTTSGRVLFYNIEDFEFKKQQKKGEKPKYGYEDYFKFNTIDGKAYTVTISGWRTPDESYSSDQIQSILLYYIEQVKDSIQDQQTTLEEEPESYIADLRTRELKGYSFSEFESSITEVMVAKVASLIENQAKYSAMNISINWISTVTDIEENIVEEIATTYLNYEIRGGYVLKKRKKDKEK
ncbi:MAG TPA: hypothetical protein VMX55_10750 [candidate division Zixibacteria bacterium]|nr:hypothetical protein [candidate division Zixibacteria bacterium]